MIQRPLLIIYSKNHIYIILNQLQTTPTDESKMAVTTYNHRLYRQQNRIAILISLLEQVIILLDHSYIYY